MSMSSGTPQICPDPESLDLLELVRVGAYRPDDSGGQWLPLSLPEETTAQTVTLVDAEGVPFAQLPLEQSGGQFGARLVSTPTWLGRLSTRPFEELYRTPADAHVIADRATTVILADRPLTAADLAAYEPESSLLLLMLAGPSTDPTARTLATLRSAAGVAGRRPGTDVVAIPMSSDIRLSHPTLYASVLQAYTSSIDRRLTDGEGAASERRGLVIFFTGLSGSGKSTLARAVRNAVLERTDRPVSLLDGDVVRRHLSSGLGFSAADRATNVRRIGWVAAQIAHHGGIAICSPIAPYHAGRQEVHDMVRSQGGRFVLIHVATPLSVCEQRDRKGLYAKARAGSIPDFTGISAPYEPPADADLVVDTSTITLAAARAEVLRFLASQQLLGLEGSADREGTE